MLGLLYFCFFSYSATFAENVPNTQNDETSSLDSRVCALFAGAVPLPCAAASRLIFPPCSPYGRYSAFFCAMVERRKAVLPRCRRSRLPSLRRMYAIGRMTWTTNIAKAAISVSLRFSRSGIVAYAHSGRNCSAKTLDSSAHGMSIAFCQKRDLYLEMRPALSSGADRAKAMLWRDGAFENVNFASVLGMLFQPEDSTLRRDTVFATTFPTSAVTEPLSGEVVNMEREGAFASAKAVSTRRYPLTKTSLADMRQIKDADELRLLRKAIDITLSGHREAITQKSQRRLNMKSKPQWKALSSGWERKMWGMVLSLARGRILVFCIIHLVAVRAEAGEVLLMDCGAEYHGYTADITRTVPVSGKFRPNSVEIYTLVYNARKPLSKNTARA